VVALERDRISELERRDSAYIVHDLAAVPVRMVP
jgi:hypothetical protein